jgi:hypothetical protein
MKLMRIHYCSSCGFNKYFLKEILVQKNKSIRIRCCNPEAKTKKGTFRILNKRLIMLGHFPKWCPLEDADFNIPKVSDKGYSHEKNNNID